jgi:hypothetical protein
MKARKHSAIAVAPEDEEFSEEIPQLVVAVIEGCSQSKGARLTCSTCV